MKEAVAYTRVSTQEQASEGVSLENQHKRIDAFCVAKDWNLVHTYEDAGVSGKNLDRDGMQKLIADCEDGNFDIVVVYKVDRISRRQRDLWYLIDDVFEANGIGFISVNEPFDTTTAFGKAALGMIGIFAQLERDLVAERTSDAIRYKIEQGQHVGHAPLGFDYDSDSELQEVDKELAIVKYAKKLRSEGYSYQKIADRFNEEGIPTKRNRTWGKSTVYYILNNKIYNNV